MDPELEARLRTLLDKEAIREVLLRYCRGVDRRDRELIEGAFHFDGPEDFDARTGGPRLADYMESFGAAVPRHTHFIGNQLIEVDGDSAHCESYFVSIHERDRDGHDVTVFRGGRYLDRLERRAGEWKIVHRTKVDDWDRIDPIYERVEGIGHEVGRPAPDDYVYRMRREGR